MCARTSVSRVAMSMVICERRRRGKVVIRKRIAKGDSPNGVVAPFWDDLVCGRAARCRISAAAVPGASGAAEAVVQFENMSFYDPERGAWGYASLETVSFEARLRPGGEVVVVIWSVPPAAAARYPSVGVESMTGAFGVDIIDQLSLADGGPIVATFTPCFAPTGEASSEVPAGDSVALAFRHIILHYYYTTILKLY